MSTTVDKLQLRQLHQALSGPSQQGCRRLSMNCNSGPSTATALSGPPRHRSLHNGSLTTFPEHCTCGVFTFFCTVWHCAYLSLWHNWNVQHSVEELNLRNGLLELVQHSHRNVNRLVHSICLPPWPGGESIWGPTWCGWCPPSTLPCASTTDSGTSTSTSCSTSCHGSESNARCGMESCEVLGTSITCSATGKSAPKKRRTSTNWATICCTRASKICTMGPSSAGCSTVRRRTRSCGLCRAGRPPPAGLFVVQAEELRVLQLEPLLRALAVFCPHKAEW